MMVACAGLYILRNHLIGPSNPNETNQNHRSNKTLNEYENSVQSINTIITTRPIAILDFSSQYGSNGSDSYVVSNICSKPEIYPLYGDSTHALAFRTYGTWWINMPSYKETIKHFSRWENHFTSRDFLDIEFGKFIDQCLYVHIYETFNPGTLEVVYVGQEDEHKNITWHRVWTFPEPFTVILENNEELVIRNGKISSLGREKCSISFCSGRQTINDLFANSDTRSSMPYEPLIVDTTRKETWKTYTRHSRPPAARLPRIVKISLENKVPFRTRFIRLEFDHSTVDYYSEIDTVTLSGTIASSNPSISTDVPSITVPSSPSVSDLLFRSFHSDSNSFQVIIEEDASSVGLTKLPFDLLFLICSYLDLRSLVRLSSTCHLLHQHCLHPLQFQSLNLQPYWNGITDYSIEHFFLHHCTQTRHLSLAWTKSIQSSSFYQLLNICSNNLVQLNLTCCQYLTEKHLKILVNVCPLIESLNLENCHSLQARDFLPLKSLNHLRLLNVYRTRIDYRTLLPLIDNNKNSLEHLNLGKRIEDHCCHSNEFVFFLKVVVKISVIQSVLLNYYSLVVLIYVRLIYGVFLV